MNIRCRVLCIGVNKVLHLRKLKFAEKDAETVAQYFETLKDKADITLLTGENATRTNILNWINQCSKIQGELNIVLFFAGHGSAVSDETQKNLERCLWIDSNNLSSHDLHRLKTAEMLKALTNPLHRLIFIIDACCSFEKGQGSSVRDIFRQFKETERKTVLKRYVIISASAVNQFAYEDHHLKHGVLTYHFLQTSSGKYTSLFRKKIPFFQFLATLDKKVRTHRFIDYDGRKRPRWDLLENGIMVHYSAENFDMPVLEPVPFILDTDKKPIQQKLLQWLHFFTCTRLRTKIYSMAIILSILLLFTYLANTAVVRVHIEPLRNYADFYDTLLGQRGSMLEEIDGSMFTNEPSREIDFLQKEFNFYLFKPNWVKALSSKLNNKGKIILKGYWLGERMDDISELTMLGYALSDSEGIFYWHPHDIRKFLKLIRWGYGLANKKQKQNALKILAKLGKEGKTTAREIFPFKKEKDQELRDLFLEHFYTLDFREKNARYFTPADYQGLIRNKKPAPNTRATKLQPKPNGSSNFLKTYRVLPNDTLKKELILNLGKRAKQEVDLISTALIDKEAGGELNIRELQDILKEFNSPWERILLKEIRHYVHKCQFGR